VAVRLGRVDRYDIDGEQSVFTDKADEARYGYITVNALDKEFISFTYTYYSFDGNQSLPSQFIVQLNESVDINGDGLADVTYTRPLRKRPGMENAVYLTFLSSQEDLNTSMFAVLPDQYSRGVYPSGIIGINIDGKFIISKYEGSTTVRSTVQGVMNGDFVLDTIGGNYQRVTHTTLSRSARSISDSELENIESSNLIVSYSFIESDFAYGYDADILFSNLPDSVRNLYVGSETSLQKLNLVLENRDLIILVSKEQDTSITEDKFVEISEQIDDLSAEEVIQINRLFLGLVYPDSCPQFISNSDGITEVLGLAAVIIGGELKDQGDYTRVAAKISSSTDYDSRFKEINSWYESSYKELWKKTLSVQSSNSTPVTLNNSFIKIGMRGTFTCVWGHIGGSIEGVVFLNTDTNLQSTVSFNRDLFNIPSGISVAVFAYGPIVLSVGGEINVGLKLQVTTDLDTAFKLRAAFAGIYGAGVEAGVKYGVTTKKVKILFVTLKLTLPYIDGYGSSWPVEKAIYYVGSDSPTKLTFKSLKVTLTPQVRASIKTDISKCLYGNITAQEGLPSSVTVKYEKPYLTGTAEIRETRSLYAEAGIGIKINIPIIGEQNFGVSKKWDLMTPIDRSLGTWQLFKTNVN
jgi:hypothetical protein